MRRLPDIRDESGLTLIELLVAAIILVVGILGTATLVAGSESTTLDAELQQVATEEAEQAIEDLRTLPYAELANAAGEEPVAPPDDESVLAGPVSGRSSDGVAPGVRPPGTDEPEQLATAPGGVPYARNFTVERGGGAAEISGTTYTYVSWRDEECGLLADTGLLDPLTAELNELGSAVNGLLGGSSGLISGVLGGLTSGLIGILNALPGPDLADDLKAALDSLEGRLETTQSQLQDATTNLAALGQADLCDIAPAQLQNLQEGLGVGVNGLEVTREALELLEPELETIQANLSSITGAIVCALLPALCATVNNAINTAFGILEPENGDRDPDELLARTNALLDDFAGLDLGGLTRDTTHNTKRITVGVTITRSREDLTPRNTVWMSSIVADPKAGLLGG